MKRIIFFSFLLIAISSVYCQQAKFVVLTVKGSVTLERNNRAYSIKAGNKLYENDKVKLNKKSYLDLVYTDGKTIELKTTGTYPVYKLIKMAKESRTSSSKKFANYVLAQFAKSVDDINNMKVTGSVERLVKPAIDYATPPLTNILDPVVTFNWFSVPSRSYIFSIVNPEGNVAYSQKISDTLITVNLQKLKLKRDNGYKWLVKDASKAKALNDTCRFFWLSQKEAKSIKDTINILMKDWRSYDQSVKQALLASYFFNHKLYVDMLEANKRAMELSPGNDTYKKLYIMALDKAGLKQMAADLDKKPDKMMNLKLNLKGLNMDTGKQKQKK